MRAHVLWPRPNIYCNYYVRAKFKPGGAPGYYDARGNTVHIHTHIYTHTHTQKHTHTHTHTQTQKHTHTHTLTQTQTHTHITHIHTHPHKDTHRGSLRGGGGGTHPPLIKSRPPLEIASLQSASHVHRVSPLLFFINTNFAPSFGLISK